MFSGKTMKKRIIIATLVLAGVHLALAVISVIIAFGSGMEAFDNPDYEPSAIDRFIGPLAEILMQPGMSLWTPWMSKNMPNIVEWTLFVANSLLWGLVFALILNFPALLKGKTLNNNGVHSISESRARGSSRIK
jgi:hypothetical protein